MTKPPAAPKPRYNLENEQVLLVEDNQRGLDITYKLLQGLGVRSIERAPTAYVAKDLLKTREFDLLICEAALEGSDGYDLVHWLRRAKLNPNSFMAAIILCSHSPMSKVAKARDCGADFIITRPMTPKILLDRIIWVARDSRAFVECQVYLGPDRRFHSIGPPPGTDGRRWDDLPLEVGEPSGHNLDQSDIDAMLNPRRPPRA